MWAVEEQTDFFLKSSILSLRTDLICIHVGYDDKQ